MPSSQNLVSRSFERMLALVANATGRGESQSHSAEEILQTLQECAAGLGGETSTRQRAARLARIYLDLDDAGRHQFLRLIADTEGVETDEAREEIREWLAGEIPADVVMDESHDNRSIRNSAKYVGEGEDEYDDDARFGDDGLQCRRIQRAAGNVDLVLGDICLDLGVGIHCLNGSGDGLDAVLAAHVGDGKCGCGHGILL